MQISMHAVRNYNDIHSCLNVLSFLLKMEVSISAVKNSTSRLVNLIDLQILRSELQGRPVLSPFLQGIKTSSSNGSARELLEFICNSGQRQAVNALVGALKAEQTHPGHKEAYQLLVQVASEANTMNTTCTFCSDVLQSCICEIEKLDFSILMPLLLQRGLITQDIFTSMQATYVTPTQNAQSIIKAIVPLGVKGIVNFIAVLQTVPSKSNEELVEVLKTKSRLQLLINYWCYYFLSLQLVKLSATRNR